MFGQGLDVKKEGRKGIRGTLGIYSYVYRGQENQRKGKQKCGTRGRENRKKGSRGSIYEREELEIGKRRKGEKGMRENGKRGTVYGEVLDPVVKWMGGQKKGRWILVVQGRME